MANSMNVADYIIKISNTLYDKSRVKRYISNLYLQKLMYFLNVIHMLKMHSPRKPLIIGSNFETWDYGPVIHDVYDEYRRFGGNRITNIVRHITSMKFNKDGTVHTIYSNPKSSYKLNTRINKDKVNYYIKIFLNNFGPFDLVEISHKEPQWKYRSSNNQIYSNKKSYEYYKKRPFWKDVEFNE